MNQTRRTNELRERERERERGPCRCRDRKWGGPAGSWEGRSSCNPSCPYVPSRSLVPLPFPLPFPSSSSSSSGRSCRVSLSSQKRETLTPWSRSCSSSHTCKHDLTRLIDRLILKWIDQVKCCSFRVLWSVDSECSLLLLYRVSCAS